MDSLEHLKDKRKKVDVIGMAIEGVILAAILALIFGVLVMKLWNWLMPAIFGLTRITFWQAWGLVLLSHILFKSFPRTKSHDHDDRWKKHFKEKFFTEKDEEKKRDVGLPSKE